MHTRNKHRVFNATRNARFIGGAESVKNDVDTIVDTAVTDMDDTIRDVVASNEKQDDKIGDLAEDVTSALSALSNNPDVLDRPKLKDELKKSVNNFTEQIHKVDTLYDKQFEKLDTKFQTNLKTLSIKLTTKLDTALAKAATAPQITSVYNAALKSLKRRVTKIRKDAITTFTRVNDNEEIPGIIKQDYEVNAKRVIDALDNADVMAEPVTAHKLMSGGKSTVTQQIFSLPIFSKLSKDANELTNHIELATFSYESILKFYGESTSARAMKCKEYADQFKKEVPVHPGAHTFHPGTHTHNHYNKQIIHILDFIYSTAVTSFNYMKCNTKIVNAAGAIIRYAPEIICDRAIVAVSDIQELMDYLENSKDLTHLQIYDVMNKYSQILETIVVIHEDNLRNLTMQEMRTTILNKYIPVVCALAGIACTASLAARVTVSIVNYSIIAKTIPANFLTTMLIKSMQHLTWNTFTFTGKWLLGFGAATGLAYRYSNVDLSKEEYFNFNAFSERDRIVTPMGDKILGLRNAANSTTKQMITSADSSKHHIVKYIQDANDIVVKQVEILLIQRFGIVAASTMQIVKSVANKYVELFFDTSINTQAWNKWMDYNDIIYDCTTVVIVVCMRAAVANIIYELVEDDVTQLVQSKTQVEDNNKTFELINVCYTTPVAIIEKLCIERKYTDVNTIRTDIYNSYFALFKKIKTMILYQTDVNNIIKEITDAKIVFTRIKTDPASTAGDINNSQDALNKKIISYNNIILHFNNKINELSKAGIAMQTKIKAHIATIYSTTNAWIAKFATPPSSLFVPIDAAFDAFQLSLKANDNNTALINHLRARIAGVSIPCRDVDILNMYMDGIDTEILDKCSVNKTVTPDLLKHLKSIKTIVGDIIGYHHNNNLGIQKNSVVYDNTYLTIHNMVMTISVETYKIMYKLVTITDVNGRYTLSALNNFASKLTESPVYKEYTNSPLWSPSIRDTLKTKIENAKNQAAEAVANTTEAIRNETIAMNEFDAKKQEFDAAVAAATAAAEDARKKAEATTIDALEKAKAAAAAAEADANEKAKASADAELDPAALADAALAVKKSADAADAVVKEEEIAAALKAATQTADELSEAAETAKKWLEAAEIIKTQRTIEKKNVIKTQTDTHNTIKSLHEEIKKFQSKFVKNNPPHPV